MYAQKKKLPKKRNNNNEVINEEPYSDRNKSQEYINEDPNENEGSKRFSEENQPDELDNVNDIDQFDRSIERGEEMVNYDNIDQAFLQTKMKIRQRSLADGAIKLNVLLDDMASDNIELYDNKDNNYEFVLNDDLGDNYQIYVESLKEHKYLAVPSLLPKTRYGHAKISDMERDKIRPKMTKDNNILFVLEDKDDFEHVDKPDITEKKNKEDKEKKEKEQIHKGKAEKILGKETEDAVFAKFDADLTYLIGTIATRISKYFLVIQGILAGNKHNNILTKYNLLI